MGHGSYSIVNYVGDAELNPRNLRLKSKFKVDNMADFDMLDNNRLYDAHGMKASMNPNGVKIRESRDSEEHPESDAIIIALDVTGSMGSVPNFMIKKGLPNIMNKIYQKGIKHPQVLFLAIGDHTCDSAPLQVGQFETSDELLDNWLGDTWLEGRGGGNTGESYMLAWYFAAFHTSIDCFEKRGKKGILITIGDEPVLKTLNARDLERIMGPGQYHDFTTEELLAEASKKYECYHIHVVETYAGSMSSTVDDWKQILKDHLFVADSHKDIDGIISDIIVKNRQGDIPNMSNTAGTNNTTKQEIIL